LFPCLGYRIQHGLADELGDAVGVGAVAVAVGAVAGAVAVAVAGAVVGAVAGAVAVAVGGVGWRDLVPAVEEAPALPLPALTGLAHFYKKINNVFLKRQCHKIVHFRSFYVAKEKTSSGTYFRRWFYFDSDHVFD
jgi:hypothetical protein